MNTILYKHPRSQFVSWPEEWTARRRYNASNEPCDMLVGFCSCGAAHFEGEAWVQEALAYYGAEIRDYPDNPSREVMLEVLGEEEVAYLDAHQPQLTLSYF